MANPFEILETRLAAIEELLRKILEQPVPNNVTSEVGGLELAQEITRLSKARIYALVSKRLLPHSKQGNRLFFNRAELLEWVASGKRTRLIGQ